MPVRLDKDLGGSTKQVSLYTKEEIDQLLTSNRRLTERALATMSGGGSSTSSWTTLTGKPFKTVNTTAGQFVITAGDELQLPQALGTGNDVNFNSVTSAIPMTQNGNTVLDDADTLMTVNSDTASANFDILAFGSLTISGGAAMGTAITDGVPVVTVNYEGGISSQSDVVLNTLTSGQFLQYDGSNWVNTDNPNTYVQSADFNTTLPDFMSLKDGDGTVIAQAPLADIDISNLTNDNNTLNTANFDTLITGGFEIDITGTTIDFTGTYDNYQSWEYSVDGGTTYYAVGESGTLRNKLQFAGIGDMNITTTGANNEIINFEYTGDTNTFVDSVDFNTTTPGFLTLAYNTGGSISASLADINAGDITDDGTYQLADPILDDLSGLSTADGNFIVGNGTDFVVESGSTARDSIGLGTNDNVRFNSAYLDSGGANGDGSLSLYIAQGMQIARNSFAFFDMSVPASGVSTDRARFSWNGANLDVTNIDTSGNIDFIVRGDVSIDDTITINSQLLFTLGNEQLLSTDASPTWAGATFTGGIEIETGTSHILLYDTDGLADDRKWIISANGGKLDFLARNDDLSGAGKPISLDHATTEIFINDQKLFTFGNEQLLSTDANVTFNNGTFTGIVNINLNSAPSATPNTYLRVGDSGAGDGNSRIGLLAENNAQAIFEFGDGDDADVGAIQYNHSDNSFSFRLNATQGVFTIASNGNVGVTGDLDVSGAGTFQNLTVSNPITQAGNTVIDNQTTLFSVSANTGTAPSLIAGESFQIAGRNGINTEASVSPNVINIDADVAMGNITNVDLTGLADGDFLQYNSSSTNWEAVTTTDVFVDGGDFETTQTGNLTLTRSGAANVAIPYTSIATSNLNNDAGWLDGEGVDDRVNALLVGGTDIGLSYDDAGNSLTINMTGTYDNYQSWGYEVGATTVDVTTSFPRLNLVGGTDIDITLSGVNNEIITFDYTGSSGTDTFVASADFNQTLSGQMTLKDSGGTALAQAPLSDINVSDLNNGSSGYVPKTGGTFTGKVTINSTVDGKLELRCDDGTTGGTPEAGWNYIEFLDGQGDRQGYFGIDNGGNFLFQPQVAGGIVKVNSDLDVNGGGTFSGGVSFETLSSNRDGQSGTVINIDHVENSTWPFLFKTSTVGNDNASGFWVNSDGTPDMRLRSTGSTVTALIHSNGTSYINGGSLAIGKTTASTTLDVNGSATFSGNVDVGGLQINNTVNFASGGRFIDMYDTSTVAIRFIETSGTFGGLTDRFEFRRLGDNSLDLVWYDQSGPTAYPIFDIPSGANSILQMRRPTTFNEEVLFSSTSDGIQYNTSSGLKIATSNNDAHTWLPYNNGSIYLTTNGDLGGGSWIFRRWTSAGSYDIKSTLSSSGTWQATDFEATSDARIKSNETPIVNALESLRGITPYHFDKNGERKVGYIAQNVEQFTENIVSKVERNGYKDFRTMNLFGMQAYNTQAIKEVDDEVTQLKLRVQELEQQVKELGGAL